MFCTVCARPATDAVHIACRGRVKEDKPRNIAMVFLTVCTDHLCATEESLIAEVHECDLCVMRICLIKNFVYVFEPAVVRILNRRTDCIHALRCSGFAKEHLSPVYELQIELLAVCCCLAMFEDLIDYQFDGLALRCMR